MKRATKFTVSPSWKVLVSDMGIDVKAVLAHARLPADLFSRKNAGLTPEEYFRLWFGVEKAAEGRKVPLLLAEHFSVESFDAPVFAAFCSADFNTAVKRIQKYKPLIGPMELDIEIAPVETKLEIRCYGNDNELPNWMALTELVFFTQIIRMGTRAHIEPTMVQVPMFPEDSDYEGYFGCKITQGDGVAISFSAKDASRAFVTSNAAMWAFFEDGLNQKLADLDATAKTAERVKAVLLEALPSGESTIELVAGKLAMSKRTLQRKLTSEDENYQALLQSVRQDLADHYLKNSVMSLGEIAFLLGFHEPNSFIRAYSTWKGVSPGVYRQQAH